MTNVTKQKTNVPQTKETSTKKNTIDIEEQPPSIQKLNTHPAHPLSAKNQQQTGLPQSQMNNFTKSGSEKITGP